MEEALSHFTVNPVGGIDYLELLMPKLLDKSCVNLAVEVSRKVHGPVYSAEELIPGSEITFSSIIYHAICQQAYLAAKAGKVIDWEGIKTELGKYEMFPDDKEFLLLIDVISNLPDKGQTIPDYSEQLKAGFGEDRDDCVYRLSWLFYRDMFERKNLSFPCSDSIWEALAESRRRRKVSQNAPALWKSFLMISCICMT